MHEGDMLREALSPGRWQIGIGCSEEVVYLYPLTLC